MPDLRLIQIRRTSHVPNLMHKLCYRGAEMTCGFLIQLIFCKNIYIYVVYWRGAREECTPS